MLGVLKQKKTVRFNPTSLVKKFNSQAIMDDEDIALSVPLYLSEEDSSDSDEKNNYRLRLTKGETIFFSEFNISESECTGFTVLDASRDEVSECLLKLITRPQIRKAMEDDIILALKAGSLQVNNPPQYHKIAAEIVKQEIAYDSLSKKMLLQYPAGKPLSEKDFIAYLKNEDEFAYKEINKAQTALIKAKIKLQMYIERHNLTELYIDALKKGLNIGPKSMLIYAQNNNISLSILQKDSESSVELSILSHHICDNTNRITHCLFVNSSLQFRILKVERIIKPAYEAASAAFEEESRVKIARPRSPTVGIDRPNKLLGYKNERLPANMPKSIADSKEKLSQLNLATLSVSEIENARVNTQYDPEMQQILSQIEKLVISSPFQTPAASFKNPQRNSGQDIDAPTPLRRPQAQKAMPSSLGFFSAAAASSSPLVIQPKTSAFQRPQSPSME